jgi:type III secretion protein Q
VQTDIHPFDPPAIDTMGRKLAAFFGLRRGPFVFDTILGEAELVLTGFVDADTPFDYATPIPFTYDSHAALIITEKKLVDALGAAVLGSGLQHSDAMTRLLALEIALEPFLLMLEQATGKQIAFDYSARPRRVHWPLGFELKLGESVYHGVLLSPYDMLSFLMDKLKESPPLSMPIRGLKATMRFAVAKAQISASDFLALAPGDAVLAETAKQLEADLLALVDGWGYAKIRVTGDGLVLSTPMLPCDALEGEGWMATDNTEDDTTADDGDDTGSKKAASVKASKTPAKGEETLSVGDVPVNLVFEVGRLSIPYKQLENVVEGYIFKLPQSLSAQVEIVANGKKIGRGEIVRIGQDIGVRILRIRR